MLKDLVLNLVDYDKEYDPKDYIEDDTAWPLGVFSVRVDNDEYHEAKRDPDGNYYMIDNNCYNRFDWDIVEEIITDKHGLKWRSGYCD